MKITKAIKMMLVSRERTQNDLADNLGVSKQQLSNILNKKDLRIHADIEKIADALGYDVLLSFRDRETGKTIDCD